MKDGLNFYLIYNSTDPDGNIRWLHQQLIQAESLNQFVYILMHEPMSRPLQIWNNHFQILMERYQHIIAGVYSGHTHQDEWFIGFDYLNKDPFILEYILPSLTTVDQSNPSYRIHIVDQENFASHDIEQYRLDITAANKDTTSKDLKFYKTYSFKQEYNLDVISPQAVYQVALSFLKSTETATKYNVNWNSYSQSDLEKVNATCDYQCALKYYCKVTYYSDLNSGIKCEQPFELTTWVFGWFESSWEWLKP